MLNIRVKVRLGTGKQSLQAIADAIRADIPPISSDYGRKVVTVARELMAEPKSGIHHPGLPNRSSAKGEPMATQSGKAAASFRIWANGSGYVTIGTRLWYANYLQAQKNRPTLEPALKKVEPYYIQAIRAMIERHT